jgi:hypothetical protein
MILSNAPQHEAIVSNVGEIGEFRIRNSAKAFNILSSGLYANKIRAIIRELSCNAVDSHVAADKKDVPFDVHLPNQLEPWFSIRDYGTGLSHDQVTNIYTTYFESTKTSSNEFIGALGLGSKSPFSYTDNFTVTAIQNGKKGIYSAFINSDGVPSIAQMMTEDTDEPAGVEVKFSVNDHYDYSKFRDEARQVYTYFSLRPVISGSAGFEFRDVEYESKDIIPGVHSYTRGGRSMAIMGNIAYPIEVPNADKNLGPLAQLLNCGLEMHFAIGEVDFQASREGLSYIPTTIDAIKRKLETVNTALTVVLAKEADAIPNLWERALFLSKRKDQYLWTAAVTEYAKKNPMPTVDMKDRWSFLKTQKVTVADLASKYNISVTAFNHIGTGTTTNNRNANTEHFKKADGSGNYDVVHYWGFEVDRGARFVINDLNIGATERAKFHWKNTPKAKDEAGNHIVFVLSRVDRAKAMDTKGFFAAINNPPTEWTVVASTLKEKPRKDNSLGKNVTILELQERGSGGYYRSKEMVWRDAGKADTFDTNTTHYYLPMSGFAVDSKLGYSFDVKRFYNDLKECGVTVLKNLTVYGVRKSDIEYIKTQKNWINIEDHIAKELSTIDNKLVMSLVLQAIDNFNLCQYNESIVFNVEDKTSPYIKLVSQFKGFEKIKYSEQSLKNLCRLYAKNVTFNPQDTVDQFVEQCKAVQQRYPLLQFLRSAPNFEVGAYINLIDTQKGVK